MGCMRASFSSLMDTADKCAGKEEEFVTTAKKKSLKNQKNLPAFETSMTVNSENMLTNYKRRGVKDLFSVPGGGLVMSCLSSSWPSKNLHPPSLPGNCDNLTFISQNRG